MVVKNRKLTTKEGASQASQSVPSAQIGTVDSSPVYPSHDTPPPFRGVGRGTEGEARNGAADKGPYVPTEADGTHVVEVAKNNELAKPGPNGSYRVGVTAEGRRAGQWHHGAHLSDADIDLIRELHEPSVDTVTGQARPGLGYRTLARKFDASKSTIRDIVKCRRRFAVVVRFKTVRVSEE